MKRYANKTTVSPDRSKGEIEKLLTQFGASEFGYWTSEDQAKVGFVHRGIRIEIMLPLPKLADFYRTPTGRSRTVLQARTERWKETRRRWRSLSLVIKALLVGVEDGVLTFEDAFMPWIVWGDGLTTRQMILPHLEKAIEAGKMPGSFKRLVVLPE